MTSAIEYKASGVWVSNGTRDELLRYIARRLSARGAANESEAAYSQLVGLGPGMGLDLAVWDVPPMWQKGLLHLLALDEALLDPDSGEYISSVLALLRRMVLEGIPLIEGKYFPTIYRRGGDAIIE